MDIALITYPMDGAPTGVGVLVNRLVTEITRMDELNRYTLLHFEKSDNPLYRRHREVLYPRLKPLPVMAADSLYLGRHPRAFDIVHRFSPGGFLLPVRSKRVVSVNDLFLYKTYEFNRHPKVVLAKWFNRRAIMGADAVIAISRYTRDEILKTFPIKPEKVHVVYCAPGHAAEPPADADRVIGSYGIGGPFILFASTIEPRKNLLTLVRAFELLKDRHRIAESLVVVGKKGWDTRETLSAISRSPCRRAIHLVGFVPDTDLSSFYRRARLFVYPSWMEGFGIPPLEAMAQGCPVLTSNTSSLPEVIGDARFMCAPGNTSEMAEKILRLLRDSAYRAANIENGVLRLKRFSWESSARQVIDIYRKVVGE